MPARKIHKQRLGFQVFSTNQGLQTSEVDPNLQVDSDIQVVDITRHKFCRAARFNPSLKPFQLSKTFNFHGFSQAAKDTASTMILEPHKLVHRQCGLELLESASLILTSQAVGELVQKFLNCATPWPAKDHHLEGPAAEGVIELHCHKLAVVTVKVVPRNRFATGHLSETDVFESATWAFVVEILSLGNCQKNGLHELIFVAGVANPGNI